MGTTFQNRTRGTTDREFFQELMGTKYRILDCATLNRATFYAAVETTEGEQVGQVWAFVALVHWVGGYWNFGYKDMDENMGPNAAECPARVLDLLTELPVCGPHRDPGPHGLDYCGTCSARSWRADCRKVADSRARAAKVKTGQVVKFARPVKFASGAELDTLTFARRDTFTADGGRYRVTGWRAMDWELVTA